MQIKIISVAITLFVILLAGCASSGGGEWSQEKTMVDNPVAADQQQTMESSMDKKESKPMWDEGSKY